MPGAYKGDYAKALADFDEAIRIDSDVCQRPQRPRPHLVPAKEL